MPRARKPDTPLAAFVRVIWRAPLYSIPFAFFFGTLLGKGWSSYVAAYEISAVFAFCVGFAVWATEFFLAPRLVKRGVLSAEGGGLATVTLYIATSVVGSYGAAILIHFTLVPGFLGSLRAVVTAGMFTLLFAVLFTGINMALFYYRQSLDRARAEQELNLARRIQRSFLLTQFPALPRLEVHAVNLSSKEVSGDFYDVVPTGDGGYLLAIADVAGKGVGAALLTQMLQASLRTQAGTTPSVAEILRNINRLAYRSTAVNQFATFFLARIEEANLRLSFSNAGHNYPIVFRRDGRRELLARGGVVVGILEDARYEEESLTLAPGDRLLLYTDGVSEAENAKGEMFGEERLMDFVAALPRELGAAEITARVVGAIHDFLAGAEPGDDITVLALRVREPAAADAAVPPHS